MMAEIEKKAVRSARRLHQLESKKIRGKKNIRAAERFKYDDFFFKESRSALRRAELNREEMIREFNCGEGLELRLVKTTKPAPQMQAAVCSGSRITIVTKNGRENMEIAC